MGRIPRITHRVVPVFATRSAARSVGGRTRLSSCGWRPPRCRTTSCWPGGKSSSKGWPAPSTGSPSRSTRPGSRPSGRRPAPAAQAPDRRLPMTRLARDLTMTSGGFTKLADRMAREGLIDRRGSSDDRRVVYATLTDEGVQIAQRLRRGVRGRAARARSGRDCRDGPAVDLHVARALSDAHATAGADDDESASEVARDPNLPERRARTRPSSSSVGCRASPARGDSSHGKQNSRLAPCRQAPPTSMSVRAVRAGRQYSGQAQVPLRS